MSETIETAASITELFSKFNDLEKAFEKLTNKQNKTDDLLHQSVTRLIFLTLNKNSAVESSDILELQKLVSEINDFEVKKSVKTAVMLKIENILSQKNVVLLIPELFDFIDALSFDQDESSPEELKILLKLYFDNFMKVKGTLLKTSFLSKITEKTKPFTNRETLDLFNDCFSTSGYDKMGAESAYMLVQAILAISEDGWTELFNDHSKIISDLWTTEFPENNFATNEQRKNISNLISSFFSIGLNIDLASKFLDEFQVDIDSVPVWQYEIYLTLIPVFVEMSDRVRRSREISIGEWDVNVFSKFGVVNPCQYASTSLCIKTIGLRGEDTRPFLLQKRFEIFVIFSH